MKYARKCINYHETNIGFYKNFHFGCVKLCHKHLKHLSKCVEITLFCTHVFEWFKNGWKVTPGARSLQQAGLRGQHWVGKGSGAWQLSSDSSNDHKLTEHEKG